MSAILFMLSVRAGEVAEEDEDESNEEDEVEEEGEGGIGMRGFFLLLFWFGDLPAEFPLVFAKVFAISLSSCSVSKESITSKLLLSIFLHIVTNPEPTELNKKTQQCNKNKKSNRKVQNNTKSKVLLLPLCCNVSQA